MPERQLTLSAKERVCDALLRVASIQDVAKRDLCVSKLQDRLGRPLIIQRHPDLRLDVLAVLTACEGVDGALETFVDIVRSVHGESAATLDLDRLVREVEYEPAGGPAPGEADGGPLLARQEREALGDLVAGVAIRVIDDVYRAVFPAADPVAAHVWYDAGEVVRQVEAAATTSSGLVAVLTFADRLGHTIGDPGDPAHRTLHAWVGVVAATNGLDPPAIRDLCVRAKATSGRLELPPPGVSHSPYKPGMQLSSELQHSSGAPVVIPSPVEQHPIVEEPDSIRLIWGGVPLRNPDFTGREQLLQALREALTRRSQASVLPQALHGLGGVGKTQLAIEYVHRFVSSYQLVWWMSAEDPTLVRGSLAELGKRLGLPPNEDLQQNAATVLNALGASSLRWVIVFDNADDPERIEPLLPSAGGHVIITSRNRGWARVRSGQSIEVDVFDRPESIELLEKRSSGIAPDEADRLADKLGDLPLALEQAATWCDASGMSVGEYLELFDRHARELLDEGKPPTYPATVYAFLRVALERVRDEAPAAAEVLELFAYLSAEPLSTTLLRSGRGSDLSPELAKSLRDPIALHRAMRDLGRYGLAKIDPTNQMIRVHRLVQLVLREDLRAERRDQSRGNVQALLAAANPHEPLERRHWPLYAEIGPHIRAAELIDAPDEDARRVVLDQTRYLYEIGDYESSRALAEDAVAAWARPAAEDGLGPDHELTLVMRRRLAMSLGMLGHYAQARQLDKETYERLSRHPDFGPDHEHTLQQANTLARDLRAAGEFQQALHLDEENLGRHLNVYGDQAQQTLNVRANVAVNLRMLGDFAGAHEIDSAVAAKWEETLGKSDPRTLFAISNLARDLYGLGRYREALELQRQHLPLFINLLGDRHRNVLLADRTVVMALRKVGDYEAAARRARDSYLNHHDRFGPDHEYTLAATMTLANCLRTVNKLAEAHSHAAEAVERYQRTFGDRHPLSLAGRVNLAIILRAIGESRRAVALDEETIAAAAEVLGARHPYTLCAYTGLASGLVLQHKLGDADELSQRTLATSREVRGERHPYTLAAGINAAFDRQGAGEEAAGQELFAGMYRALGEVLGAGHPEVQDAERGKRLECDIEAPPT